MLALIMGIQLYCKKANPPELPEDAVLNLFKRLGTGGYAAIT